MIVKAFPINITFIFLTFAAVCVDNTVSQCTWSINGDLPKKDPVIFRARGKRASLLVPATDAGYDIKSGATVTAFCPGRNNYLRALGRDAVDFTCEAGRNIAIDDLKRTTSDLECLKAPSGDIRNTNKKCLGRRGTVLDVGYESPSGWLYLYGICYDFTRSIALYSHHTLYGASIRGAFIGSNRPGFRKNALRTNISIDSAYNQRTQLTRFRQLLGDEPTAIYVTNSSYLSRGHLAPDADFLLNSWQRNTYFYANVVPQWMAINAGNWKKVENSIRESASRKRQNYKIWTGTSQDLQLPDENGNLVRIFLGKNESIPIPKYIWKLVCDTGKNCIVVVVHNDPFSRDEGVCNSVCRESGWYKEGFEMFSRGLTVCCDVESANSTLTLPNVGIVRDILNF